MGGDSHLLLAPQNPGYEVQAKGKLDGPLGKLGGPRAQAVGPQGCGARPLGTATAQRVLLRVRLPLPCANLTPRGSLPVASLTSSTLSLTTNASKDQVSAAGIPQGM